MNKEELKNYLNIIIGELKKDIDNEEGCFDETATKALKKILSCTELLCKDAKTKMVQLNKSVETICMSFIWIDGIVEDCEDENHIFFSTSDEDDIFNTELNEVDRDHIIEVMEEVIKMCE